MKKKLLLLSLSIFFVSVQSQTQIGDDINGDESVNLFGYSVSLSSDGSILGIGAPNNNVNGIDSGQVRVYENTDGNWTQIGNNIDGESASDNFGSSLCLSSNGNVIAVGAYGNDMVGSNSGHVRIYENLEGSWLQIGNDINGEAEGDYSGFSVSLSSDGNIVAIGGIFNDGNGSDSGHVRVYQNFSGTWSQIGSDIDGEAPGDYFGYKVSLSSNGNILAVGAPFNDGNGSDSGHVRVYENVGGSWSQIGSDIDGEAAADRSGLGVSLSSDGSILAVGAAFNDGNGLDSGHVRVYENINGSWTQIGNDINGEAANDYSGYFGLSLSSDGSIVAIGAYGNDGNGSDSGHVRVYENIGNVWTQIGNDIDGKVAGDNSGIGLSLSSNGSIVAVGEPYNDDYLPESGKVRIYNLSAVLSSDEFVKSKILPRAREDFR